MWLDVLKALPQKEAIEPMLRDDKGVPSIIGLAKLPDKKGLKNAVDETKRLSEGNISTDYNKEDRDKIIENAEKAYKALKEILDEYRKEQQPGKMTGRIKEILKDILEEGDMDRFKEFIGTREIRRQRNSREKIKAVKELEDDVKNFINENKEDFYWVNVSSRKLLTVDEPPEYIKGEINQEEIDGKKFFVIDLPDKMGLSDYKKVSSWFMDGKKKKPLGYKTEGRVQLAPLVAIFGLLTSRAAQDATDPFTNKRFTVNVNTGEDAVKYLSLLTKPRWKKSSEFMPKPNLRSSGATVAARKSLLMPQGKVLIPSALRAILVNPSLDINSLMEEGVKQTKEKIVPNFVRMVLMGEEQFDLEEQGINQSDFTALQKLFSVQSKGRMTEFVRRVNRKGGSLKSTLDTIIEFYVDKQNMFSEEEAMKLESIKDKMDEYDTQAEHKQALEELYKTIPDSLADAMYDLMDEAEEKGVSLFTKVGEFYKLKLTGLDKETTDRMNRDFRSLRMDSEKVSMDVEDSSWTKIEEEYNEDYDLSSTAGLNVLDIFHIIALLDWYYAQTDLYEKIQDWLNPDDYEEEDVLFDEVKAAAIQNFGDIVNSFIEATKQRVDDIVTRPKTYQDKLVYTEKRKGGSATKATKMIRDLQEAGVVSVVE